MASSAPLAFLLLVVCSLAMANPHNHYNSYGNRGRPSFGRVPASSGHVVPGGRVPGTVSHGGVAHSVGAAAHGGVPSVGVHGGAVHGGVSSVGVHGGAAHGGVSSVGVLGGAAHVGVSSVGVHGGVSSGVHGGAVHGGVSSGVHGGAVHGVVSSGVHGGAVHGGVPSVGAVHSTVVSSSHSHNFPNLVEGFQFYNTYQKPGTHGCGRWCQSKRTSQYYCCRALRRTSYAG